MNSNRVFKDFRENQLISRLETLLESSRPTIPRHTSPLNSSKLQVRASNSEFSSLSDKSFYDKYSRLWANKAVSKASISYFFVLYKKLTQKIKIHAWQALFKSEFDKTNNPLAFTLCSKCGTASLTLLTTSTQDKLSPRFLNKVKSILPKTSKNSFFSNTQKKSFEKFSLSGFPKDLNTSPERKIPISEMSPIIPNSYFLSSLSSPEQMQKTKVGKVSDEVSFDLSQESWGRNKEKSNLPKQVIPKLKIRKSLDRTGEGLQRIFSVIEYILYKKKDDILKILTELREYQVMKIEVNGLEDRKKESREITSGKKTAFKILHSRLEKFLFRRKMQGFYSISELLYR